MGNKMINTAMDRIRPRDIMAKVSIAPVQSSAMRESRCAQARPRVSGVGHDPDVVI
jgi:hypothetical protein